MADTMSSAEVPEVDPSGATDSGSEANPEAGAADEPTITVEIDGKMETLTPSQIAAGFLRQGDYTRKTQEIAESRRRLETLDRFERSLDDDPLGTLQQLAQAYSVELTPAQQAAADAAVEAEGNQDDPVARELAELKEWRKGVEAQFSQRQEAEMQAQIEADLDAVRTQFSAPDLDEVKLLEFAIERNIPDLKDAYRLQLALAAEDTTSKPEPKVPSVPVEGGSSRTGSAAGGDGKMSIEQAFASAKTTHGFG